MAAPLPEGLILHPDGCPRCWWAGQDPLYVAYHDTEWGVPEFDSRALYEKLILDGFQAGLSWITILKRREGFRAAFDGFNPEIIARYTDADVARLMADTGIIRNRAKIESTIGNARIWLELDDPVELIWSFVDGVPLQPRRASMAEVPASTPESDRMSKALKKLGFRFVGTTICYAYMQACGLVNDHVVTCFRHDECAALG